MTMTRPLRLITLHFSQIRFTDGFTFIAHTSFCNYIISCHLASISRFFPSDQKKFMKIFEAAITNGKNHVSAMDNRA